MTVEQFMGLWGRYFGPEDRDRLREHLLRLVDTGAGADDASFERVAGEDVRRKLVSAPATTELEAPPPAPAPAPAPAPPPPVEEEEEEEDDEG